LTHAARAVKRHCALTETAVRPNEIHRPSGPSGCSNRLVFVPPGLTRFETVSNFCSAIALRSTARVCQKLFQVDFVVAFHVADTATGVVWPFHQEDRLDSALEKIQSRLTSRLPGCQTSESARPAGPLARLHKKPAAIAVVHCWRFLKFRRDMGSLLYTEGQNISCHA
jgi:hypothetical protein